MSVRLAGMGTREHRSYLSERNKMDKFIIFNIYPRTKAVRTSTEHNIFKGKRNKTDNHQAEKLYAVKVRFIEAIFLKYKRFTKDILSGEAMVL